MKQNLKDFWFYNNKIKTPLKKEKLYDEVMNKWSLKGEPYGVFYKLNQAGQKELQKDPNAPNSIFDDHCFIFYLVKYCEIMGLEAVIASQEHISYFQKRRVIDHVVNNECSLGVQG